MQFEIDNYGDVANSFNYESVYSAELMVQRFFGFVFGILLVIIVFLTFLVTVIDVVYITSPVFRESGFARKWSGERDTSRFKLRFISFDAVSAVEESAVDSAARSALGLYIKKRWITLLKLGVIVGLLTLGSGRIVAIVAKFVIPLLQGFKIFN